MWGEGCWILYYMFNNCNISYKYNIHDFYTIKKKIFIISLNPNITLIHI